MKILKILFLLLAAVLILSSCGEESDSKTAIERLASDPPSPTGYSIINPDSEVRGIWIASVFNIDYPSQTDLSADKLKYEIDDIISYCKKYGLNTVFFQVRPSCDALYDSDIFPVSTSLSSTGTLNFDPLAYFVNEAHKNNIFLHAWVNPLRITTSANAENSLSPSSPAVIHPEWTVKYTDGKLYFNAGLPEVRDLVADGVREIVTKYDVDGVVFDDYFYPYPQGNADFADDAAYKKYGGGFKTKADWRRDNINLLIKQCYDTVKATDPECIFGVSPGGVWQNNDGTNGGSDTRGFETYHSLYCDTLAWVRGGYVDYVSPQIYWNFDSSVTPFAHLTEWWNTQLDGSGVELWISHGAYFYDEGAQSWKDPEGEMKDQVEYAREALTYRGSMFYGYDELKRNHLGISDELSELYRDEIIYCDPSPTGGVGITSHYYGEECSVGNITVTGYSDPSVGLKLDGENVGRHKDGSFEVELQIKKGENKFTFSQNGKTFSLSIIGK
ncbi:MAG: family 10 glycosylhydrolase [Clostridia bacterium]|nr:family 10 glycosylhydrolase [Clostridia bacterium]